MGRLGRALPNPCSRALLLAALLLFGCRDADSVVAPSGIALPIVPNLDGSSGCVGPDPAFDPLPVPAAVDLGGFALSALSQVAAARGAELLYVSGADGAVAQVDLSDPDAPLVTVLVAPGVVADLLLDLGVALVPALSGLAVVSPELLVVMEHASNVLLAVDRLAPDGVALLAGLPSAVPGFADGPALPSPVAARFGFAAASAVVPVERAGGGKELYVADSGNHAIRLVAAGQVRTVVGDGLPQTLDGGLSSARLDGPVGLVATCTNALLVSEAGEFGGGHVLRRLGLLDFGPFLGRDGELVTLLGLAGVEQTLAGGPGQARLAAPRALATSAEGALLWIDAGTGVLRRFAHGLADCPLAADCESAVAAPSFTPGAVLSLALTDSGTLYVLDAEAQVLWRIEP